jgi:GMP synthase (glutamine-hydrolysing)
MIMEDNRPLPDNIGDLLGEARELWMQTQKNTAEVSLALVTALDLMTEHRKMPVFSLNVVKTDDSK